MGILKSKTGGFMDQIRCDEPSYLVWKWHPSGVKEGEGNRENAIRWGSSLRVKDGEVAVFVYNQNNGLYQDFIEGPFDQKIKTSNLPVLARFVSMAYDGGTPFQAEVYFINLARIVQTRFGVPFFDVFDPRFDDFSVPVAVRGTISFQIKDYREFIKLHRLSTFDFDDFQKQIRDAVNRYIKNIVANTPSVHNIPVVQLEKKTGAINDEVEYELSQRLQTQFGVLVSSIDIGTIEIDKSSDGYRQLMSVTKDVTQQTIEAQKEASIKNIYDKQRIEMRDYEENLRIKREEGQYAVHKQTQSANMGAFQVEKQAEVGVEAAKALGQMGQNGAGSVDLGSGGIGFNPAAMMAGMAMGGVVGKTMAGNLEGIITGGDIRNQPVAPPIPETVYYVAINGAATGPFTKDVLRQMFLNGQLDKDALMWKQGMSEWKKAIFIQELSDILIEKPPIPTVDNT